MTKRSRVFNLLSRCLLTICLIITLVCASALDAQTSSSAPTVPGRYTPAAEPKAVTIHGNARFTVLTPQLIRIDP